MRLSHFTSEPFSLKGYEYSQVTNMAWKPKGLWLSDESDYGWSKWCRENEFGLKNLRYKTDFEIDLKKILLVGSSSDFKFFENKYDLSGNIKDHIQRVIDGAIWTNIASDYSGIVITPYFNQFRLESFWYYGWDCASGCIWDLSAVKQLGQSELFEGAILK